MIIKIVGVVGAGVMGQGVAQNLAQAGYPTILLDIDSRILTQARQNIEQNIRFQTLFSQTGQTHNPADVLQRITFTTDYQQLADADFVIENVPEKWEIKQQVFAQLDAVCPAHCILASNTSVMPITRLASATARPAQVIGLHFMNPVPMKPVVEMACGFHTDEKTTTAARELLTGMGKEAIQVDDSPGFVSNRVLMLTINEAIFLLHEQVSSPADIDRIFKTCFGHKMGPLETADLIGLDTILYSIEALYHSFNDSKYRPCPLLKKMVDAGLYGRKNGQGFYSYSAETGLFNGS